MSPPARWSEAYIGGLYIEVEGIGAQRTMVKVRNWQPTMQATSAADVHAALG